jgi:hypothetical protein
MKHALTDERINAISFCPFGHITAWANKIEIIEDHLSLKTQPSVLFARRDFLEDSRTQELSACIKKAWLKLLMYPELRSMVIKHLIMNTDYTHYTALFGGLYMLNQSKFNLTL